MQTADDALSFAFAHKDERDPSTSWHVLGALASHDADVQLDVEVSAEGARPPLVPPLGMPAFMVSIVDNVGLKDVRPLSSVPTVIKAEGAAAFAGFSSR